MSPKDVLPVYSGPLPGPGVKKRTASTRPILIAISVVFLIVWYYAFPERWMVDLLRVKNFLPQSDSSDRRVHLVKARHGAVASQNKQCSDIGVDVLKRGGNAVDAAVSTVLCIGVVNMFFAGIGGGGFMIVRIPQGRGQKSEAWTIDFRETAPRLANSTMFVADPSLARAGGLSVSVPGELRGLEEAHRRWGKLPWKTLVEPSITLAKGSRVGPELELRMQSFTDMLLTNPDWSPIFAPHGRLLKEGDIIRRNNLSRTLSYIAKHGAGAFYKGRIADSIVKKVRSTGGILSHADLENYHVNVEPALEGLYRGRRVMTTNAPSSGPALLHMLNIVERFDFNDLNALNIHRMVEAMKFGFSARTRICDPKFASCDLFEISSKGFAAVAASNITDDRTHPSEYYRPEYDLKPDHGTSHTSIVDSSGMAVSVTSTVNLLFGSQVMDPETGVILNDEMDDFSIPGVPNAFGLWPSPYNYPEPGKRSLSSTSPTIIENPDGTLHLVVGGAGGSRIFPGVFQVILNVDWGMDIGQAIEHGRIHDQLYPSVLEVEDTYPSYLVEELRARGHNITEPALVADIEGVTLVNGYLYAASDYRTHAEAAGY